MLFNVIIRAISHCLYIHILRVHPSVDFGLFPHFGWLLWIMLLSAFMDKVSVWTYVFKSLRYIPRSGGYGLYGNAIFNFWGIVKLFSTISCTFWHSHQQYVRISISLHLHQHVFIIIILVADSNHQNECEIIPCGFKSYFPSN